MSNISNDMLPSLKAPIIEAGKTSGYDVVENYDLGAGPIDVAWIFKPGFPEIVSLPDIRIGFVFALEYSEAIINRAISKSLLNLVDKLVIVVPSESMPKKFKESIEKDMEKPSLLQLRKYITVLTPSTIVEKSGVTGTGTRGKDDSNINKLMELD
jgi:hypothetical protein